MAMKRVPWPWLLVSAAAGVAVMFWLVDSMMPPLARDYPQGELRTRDVGGDTVVSAPRFAMIVKNEYSSQREDETTTVRPYNRVEHVLIPPSQTNLLVVVSIPASVAGFDDFGPEPGYVAASEEDNFTLYRCSIPYVRDGKETVLGFARGSAYQMIFYIDRGEADLSKIVQYLHVY